MQQLKIFKEEELPSKRKYTRKQKSEFALNELTYLSMEQITGREEITKPVLNKVESGATENLSDTSMKRCVWFKKKK